MINMATHKHKNPYPEIMKFTIFKDLFLVFSTVNLVWLILAQEWRGILRDRSSGH